MYQKIATAIAVNQMQKKFGSQQQKPPFWRFDNWVMWLIILLIIFLFFPLYRYIIKQIQKTKDVTTDVEKIKRRDENNNPLIVEIKAKKITPRIDIQNAALKIAQDLGTYYDKGPVYEKWFNYRWWTENDESVYKTLLFQRKNYQIIKKLYFECYSNSGDLTADLNALLDKKYLDQLRKYITI